MTKITSRLGTCPFCVRLHEGKYDEMHNGVATFEPLNPVVPGHRLFIPILHTRWEDASAAYDAGSCVLYAVRWANTFYLASFNIITSCGSPATQSVTHLHVHLVPRQEGDELRLPWSEH